MNRERWQEVQRLLERALELAPAERVAFVRKECGADAELAEEVLKLLRTEVESRFLAPPAPLADDGPAAIPRRLGDFELLEVLGRGRFGIVYRARQISLGGRIVALKVLPPSIELRLHDVDRFNRESRTAARLHHPNIVPILTVGEQDGWRYFAMDLIPGPTLAAEIRRLREQHGIESGSGTHLPSSRAETYFRAVAELVRQVADGLQYAHENEVVHRDVKPANLMLDAAGRSLIVDFGLARDEEQDSITKSEVVAGTPHYMSPEQARGIFHRVDARTDVYSLGVVLYELLTLQRPFEGSSTYEILRKIREEEAPRIDRLNPRVPRDLRVICNKAMAKSVLERYPSAGAVRDELARFLAGEAILTEPPSLAQVAGKFVYRRRRALLGAALVVIVLVLGLSIAHSIEEEQRIAGLLRTIDAARAEGPLGTLPLTRQLELRAALTELAREPGVRAAEVDDRVRATEHEFEILHDELSARGRESLERARMVGQPAGAREFDRLSGLWTLFNASLLFPEDAALRELARIESAYPTIQVQAFDERGEPTGADVFLREVDVLTSGVGARHRLGRTPLAATPVLPGYYRVVVAFDAGGFRELICNPGPAFMKVELEARRRTDDGAPPADMVRIDACSWVIREFPGQQIYRGKPVELESFWIDTAEVSNAQYRAFQLATGRSLPRFWNLIEDWDAFLAKYGDLPAIGATWNDAVAYAEWAGKRLPTAAEWSRASGGPQAWPTPYSPDANAPPRGNVSRAIEPVVTERERWELYLRAAVPVRSDPEARTPEGLYHMWGNVCERTESMTLAALEKDGALVPQPYERTYFGGRWDAVATQTPMYGSNSEWLATGVMNDRLGFRCAKSAAP